MHKTNNEAKYEVFWNQDKLFGEKSIDELGLSAVVVRSFRYVFTYLLRRINRKIVGQIGRIGLQSVASSYQEPLGNEGSVGVSVVSL